MTRLQNGLVNGGLRRVRLAALVAGVAFGLAAEWVSYQPGSQSRSIADLVVGWVLIGSGLLTWERRPQSRFGPLMALSGGAWFLGSVVTAALYLHRGPLIHALLSYPSGRHLGRFRRVVVAVGYAEAAIQPLGGNPAATLVLCGLVAAAAVHGYASAVGPRRRARAGADLSALALALVLGLGSIARITGWNADTMTLWVYEGVIVIIALSLLADLLRGRWSEGAVTGLVVDLGGLWEQAGLRDRLARALGDSSLVLGYWVGAQRGYVDEAGRPVVIPVPGDARAVTRIESADEPVAVLVHDRAVLDDRVLIEAVATAAAMALETVRLEVDVRNRVAELEASRRRILDAAGAQRRRLERELRQGAEARLAAVSRAVGMLTDITAPSAVQLQGEVEEQLVAARAELRELGRGIHPQALTKGGLAAAVSELAARGSFPVEVRVDAGRWPAAVESAVYYVCSEALANAAKYACASRVQIGVEDMGGWLAVTVVDDGIGGAHASSGSGLDGLAERVQALGGRLSVQSPPGGGTRILANVPTS